MLAVLIPAAGRYDPKPGRVKRAAGVAEMEQEDRGYYRRDEPGGG
jgi:hypothetical protein